MMKKITRIAALLAIALMLMPVQAFADTPYDYTGEYFRMDYDGFIYLAHPDNWKVTEIDDESDSNIEQIMNASDSNSSARMYLYYIYDPDSLPDYTYEDWYMDCDNDDETATAYFEEYGFDALSDLIETEFRQELLKGWDTEHMTTDSYTSFIKVRGKMSNGYMVAYVRGACDMSHQILIFTSKEPFTYPQLDEMDAIANTYDTDDQYAREQLSDPFFDLIMDIIFGGIPILIIVLIVRKIVKKNKSDKPRKKTMDKPAFTRAERDTHEHDSEVSVPVSNDSHYVESLNTLVKSGLLTRSQRSEMLDKYYDSLK